jgi:hypothetical protein
MPFAMVLHVGQCRPTKPEAALTDSHVLLRKGQLRTQQLRLPLLALALSELCRRGLLDQQGVEVKLWSLQAGS